MLFRCNFEPILSYILWFFHRVYLVTLGAYGVVALLWVDSWFKKLIHIG